MIHLLATALLAAAPARAIENLECEYALATARETEVVPGHVIILKPGQVLIRGHLEAFRMRSTGDVVHFGVRDEMVVRRIFRKDAQGLFGLSPRDEVYLLDAARTRVLMHTHYAQLPEHGKPQFLIKPDDLSRRLNANQVERLFEGKAEVVVVRALTEDGFARARENYLPAIEAHAAHQNNPERILRLNAEETIELAHYEAAHTGGFLFGLLPIKAKQVQLTNGQTLPAMTLWELNLILTRPDGSRMKLGRGETIVLLGENNRVLLKYTLMDEKIIMYPPFDKFERELCSLMLFVNRAVIIKPK